MHGESWIRVENMGGEIPEKKFEKARNVIAVIPICLDT